MKNILLLLFYFVSPLALVAQDDDLSALDFPDTVYAVQLKSVEIKNFDSLRMISCDTIHQPECLVIEAGLPGHFGADVYIAFQRKDHWDLYVAVENGGDIKTERVDFNNEGNKELLISDRQSAGLSWRDHGWGEHSEQFYIVDLDKLILLGTLENYSSHQDWWAEYDENDSVTASGGSQYCTNYKVKVLPGEIILTESNDCPSIEEEKTQEILKPEVIKYILKENYLVRVK